MGLFHLVAHLAYGSRLLTEHEVASEFWWRLERAFPDALSACLMPNHCHVIAFAESSLAGQRGLVSVIRALRRTHAGAGTRWQPVPEPIAIVDTGKARRGVRYVALNPSRDRLVKDPLEWAWSTHRDVVGAVAKPWVDAERLARALDRPTKRFTEWLHRYVSSTPEVSLDGTPLPTRGNEHFGEHGIARFVAAAAAATRARPRDIRRKGPTRATFIVLASQHGWPSWLVAELCGMTTRGVRHQRARPYDVRAAALCLGDERLCRPYAVEASRLVRPVTFYDTVALSA